jgi:hypothetical protein
MSITTISPPTITPPITSTTTTTYQILIPPMVINNDIDNLMHSKNELVLQPINLLKIKSHQDIKLPNQSKYYSTSFSEMDTMLSKAPRLFIHKTNTSLLPHPQFTFTVNVITYNRPHSLKRLCQSLLNSQYYNHTIHIRFYVDNGADQETIQYVSKFQWSHGIKSIHLRHVRGGLVTAVLESWYPAHDHDYVLLAEDDIQLSPYWYKYVLKVLSKYRYNNVRTQDIDMSIYGISLYTPRLCENSIPRRKFYPSHTIREPLYLHQIPCSWGAVYFPQNWVYYRYYIEKRKYLNVNVHIPHAECNGWTESWVKYYTELNYLKGWHMIYPNLLNETSLSTNWLESGVHVNRETNNHEFDDFHVPLLMDETIIDNMVLPNVEQLKIVDYKCDMILDRITCWRKGSLSWKQFLHVLYLKENTPPT